jgi:hypothetical protein
MLLGSRYRFAMAMEGWLWRDCYVIGVQVVDDAACNYR